MEENNYTWGDSENSAENKDQRVQKRFFERKAIRDLGEKEKYALKSLFVLRNAAKKQKESDFCLHKIETLGPAVNSEVRSLNFQEVDLPMPCNILEMSSGMGVFNDLPAMERIIKNSKAWIREILKHPPYKPRDNKSKILKDDKLITSYQRALCVLFNHPNWTDKEIAKEVGVNRTSLYRWQIYKDARTKIKEEGKKGLQKGYKTQDGDIEAYK